MAESKKRVSIGLTDKQFELVEKIAKEKGFCCKVLNLLSNKVE
ncbi:CopG family transcriptional regulator [Enterococcus faecium]